MQNSYCLLGLVLNEVRVGGSPQIKGTLRPSITFFIFIVQQDTFNVDILQNIHKMADLYNCSQIQAIIQSFDKVLRHTCTVVFYELMLWSSMEG